MSSVGVVIIGRNEGGRLATCLASVRKSQGFEAAPGEEAAGKMAGSIPVVYVDSNSTDDSMALAKSGGAEVVELDPAQPFTAARARNAGAETLLARFPDIAYIQFVDGDTELIPTWLQHAASYLDHHANIAVVCGRRRERFPDATVYNLLADMEWDTPVGHATEFGGDAMIRAAVFRKLGGYAADFIAGEEPEFAARMRLAGCRIMRLNHEMTLHDLGMKKLGQWWRRTVRSGHALAQLHHTHGKSPLRLYRKQWRSTLVWTLGPPAVAVLLAIFVSRWLLLLLPVAYLALWAKITRHRIRHDGWAAAIAYGGFTTLGKFPQFWGMMTFYRNRWRGRQTALMEYKGAAAGNRAGGDEPAASSGGHPTTAPVGNTS
ncbi:MAG TPA: glycosyltransferase family A protein [Phycisphaerae bacterium]|nr:glycosyltransferase family A protein [Phycisphaerae bacterium]